MSALRGTGTATRRGRQKPLRGVALVITLIMLAVITVIAITILAIVRRDRNNATQALNLTDARFAAEAGFERARAEIVAQIRYLDTMMGYDLTVSRSVSNKLDLLQMDPRVPVFPVGLLPDERLEGRFFLDLNRNSFFEPTFTNGVVGDPQWIGLLNKPDQPHGPNNRFLGRMAFLVQPAGKTLDVNFIHNMTSAQTVQFGYFRNEGFGFWELNLAAFLADLTPSVWSNYLYEPPSATAPLPAPITVGVPFADARSLLAYRYRTNDMRFLPSIDQLYGFPGLAAFSTDFIDNYASASNVMGLLYPAYEPQFPRPNPLNNGLVPWPGADAPRHYFTHQEFYDPLKTSSNWVSRLLFAGAQTNDPLSRYTFYRMLAQLGTDSSPLFSGQSRGNCPTCLVNRAQAALVYGGKFHINYASGLIAPETLARIRTVPAFANLTTLELAPTNFVPWDLPEAPELATMFFTNLAQVLFEKQFREFNPSSTIITNRAGQMIDATGLIYIPSITAIPIAPTNHYSPALHRLLQVTANIFDATRTNRFPSVFRPLFTVVTTTTTTNVTLTGWTNDNRRSTIATWLADNRQHGVPVVVGAKKGFPNFNECSMRTDVQLTRKLEFFRAQTNLPPSQTNQMYVLGISNLFAVEAWNSYDAPYTNALLLEASDLATVTITNERGYNFRWTATNSVSSALPPRFWTGKSFLLPLNTNQVFIPPSVYRFRSSSFDPVGLNLFETGVGFPVPNWYLTLTNEFLYILSDGDNIVDFLTTKDFSTSLDFDSLMMRDDPVGGLDGSIEDSVVAQLWNTNRPNGTVNEQIVTFGILKQIDVALGNQGVSTRTWTDYLDAQATTQDKDKSIAAARDFFGLGSIGGAGTNFTPYPGLKMQSPFNPTRKLLKTITWQANDPLVHYHVGDLLLPGGTNVFVDHVVPPTFPVPVNLSHATLTNLNENYAPWGGNPKNNQDPMNPMDPYAYNPATKDPGVKSSDDWDFPNGKFPSVGWLGRVHRGTPWQSVYFKPEAIDVAAWATVSADFLWYPTNGDQSFRFVRAYPTNDWILADIFTAATDANSMRGLLSINQTNLAAWSAVLSGVALLQNPRTDEEVMSLSTNKQALVEVLVQPWAVDVLTNPPPPPPPATPAIQKLVDGINVYRKTLPNGTFTSLSQFLQVPELTINSPWLNTSSQPQQWWALTDTAYERLPMQILSLVKIGEPRFVIYAYGQSLKPADGSIDPATRVCRNYQVTAEVAVRAVVRVEGTPVQPRTVIETFNILPPD
ncbi:MAG: pilus assembly PilX N-terminal domain-containing protein [Verrucomicrobia bacterium]|nr:pilus assembly PilX N-terminal domain-containing protein [Verrucomicrobiota bacterium]